MHKQYKLRGFFVLEIVDAKSKIVEKTFPVKQNMILNQGKDYVAQRTFVENILYCAVGGGTTSPLATDTGLVSETMRTGAIDTTVVTPCSSTLVGNVLSLTKTFAFPAVTFPTAIGEIGWSYTPAAGANLFSKSIIVSQGGTPGLVTIDAGKYLRVYYTLQITINPSTSQSVGSQISGWPTASGQYMAQYIGLRTINISGGLAYYDAGLDCNEPSATGEIFLGTSSAALASFGSSTDRSGGTNYTAGVTNQYVGNGLLYKKANFGKGSAASSTLRSMGVGIAGSSYTTSGFVFLFNSNQTKDTNFLLPLKFIYSWG